MTSESPEIQRLTIGLTAVDFYLHHPIVEPFIGIDPRVWFALLDSLDPSVLNGAPITPTGISIQALNAYRAGILNLLDKLRSSVPLQPEETELINTIPPNLPELVKEMEAARGRQDLDPTVKKRLSSNLDMIKRAIAGNWEKRRLEVLEEKLKTTREEALQRAKNRVAAQLEVYATQNPPIANARNYIAEDIQAFINEVSPPQDPNIPRGVEEINKDVAKRTGTLLTGKSYNLSPETAQEIIKTVLADNAVKNAIETARKTIFVEQALNNQFFPGTTNVNPEALQNLADEETVRIIRSSIEPVQKEFPQKTEALSANLVKIIRTKIIPPFNTPFLTSPPSMVQNAREASLLKSIEEFLQKNVPRRLMGAILPIRLDTVQSLILEAANLSNTSWWKQSSSSLGGQPPFSLIHPQVRNSLIINQGGLRGLEGLIPRGVIPSLEKFFNINQGAAWFSSFIKGTRDLPHIQFLFLHRISLPFLGKLYQPDEWGYIIGPVARLKNAVFTRTIQFVGSSLIKMGTSKVLQGFGGEILAGIGARLLGFAAGGPMGFALAFAPQILSLAAKFSPAVRLVKQISSRYLGHALKLAAAGLVFLVGSLGPFTVAGGLLGFVVGAIFGPSGAVIGGGAGLFFGRIIDFIVGLTGKTGIATTTSAAPLTTSAITPTSSISMGSLVPAVPTVTSIASASPIITVGVVGTLTVFNFLVTSESFFAPEGAEQLLGSKHIVLKKSVNVGGIDNPNSVQNTVIGGKAIYQLIVEARDISLNDVIVTDKTTVTNKNGTEEITDRFMVDTQGNLDPNQKTPPKWDKTIDPQLQELAQGTQWSKKYGFTLIDKYKDSFISNTVTINATSPDGKPETKSITLTFKIGNPPLPPVAQIAKNLIDRLHACYGPKVKKTNFGNGSCVKDRTKNPVGVTFKDDTIAELRNSVSTYIFLQCVGFVRAVLIEVGVILPIPRLPGDAKDYFNITTPDYKWYDSSNLKQIQPGDIFVSKRFGDGHIAIVYFVNGDPVTGGFQLAEALGDSANQGIVQYTGVMWTFDPWVNNPDIGFLRYTK